MTLSTTQKAEVLVYHKLGWNATKIAKVKETGSHKRDARQLKRLVREDRRGNLEDYQQLMTVKLHQSTLRRVKFAKEHKDWTKVLWTDEASFERGQSIPSSSLLSNDRRKLPNNTMTKKLILMQEGSVVVLTCLTWQFKRQYQQEHRYHDDNNKIKLWGDANVFHLF
ncbi:hypothetical protein BCR42DRAFT_444041 [Absidia repens]|uniref:Uncharacterized protein n=1 Tax=Absidia repens TaxID=90262 RepID=A0A1X2HXJ0_9FUNG|nr:hypothetical protein BCR42DRAFT_444041 [Absidia repens]